MTRAMTQAYVLDENTALVQTTDFFPPIVDDPFLCRTDCGCQRAQRRYAMGGEPKLALNIMCLAQSMDDHAVQGNRAAATTRPTSAGAIITGGHTIQGAGSRSYGLAVSLRASEKKVLHQQRRKAGDVLILTKLLGVGVLTTAKAIWSKKSVLDRIYRQMAALNKAARDVMVQYLVHSCTDVTGFHCSATALRWHRAAAFPHLRAQTTYPIMQKRTRWQRWD